MTRQVPCSTDKETRPEQYCLALLLIFVSRLGAQVPVPAHIVIAIEENHDYTQIIGSTAAPYVNALAADSNAALFSQSYGLTHPSQPNYIMLYSGSNQGVIDDNLPSGLPFTTVNLGASLLYTGKTFTGYSEDLPSVGFNGTTSGAYARKHNPWVNWQSSPTNGLPPTTNVPLTYFPSQYDSLPTVSFVVPNQNNDMHNGSDPARITTGDTWLHNHLDGYVQWAKTHNSLFILTFDEGTTTGSNRIVTVFAGQMVRHGTFNETITHFSVLRTLEEMFGLPHVGGSISATPITSCWLRTVDVRGIASGLPAILAQNYPNPFNPTTDIRYQVPAAGHVELTVLDVLGRAVNVLVNEQQNAGSKSVRYDASGLAGGVYFYRLVVGGFAETKRMVVLK